MNTSILEKFTQHYKQVIYKSYRIAQETAEKVITPEHLLWGLLQQRGSLASELLKKFNLKVQLNERTADFEDDTPPPFDEGDVFPFSQHAQRIIERSVLIASHYDHTYVGTEHLLQSILQNPDPSIQSILKLQHISRGTLETQVVSILKSTSRFPELVQSVGDEDLDGNFEAPTEGPFSSLPSDQPGMPSGGPMDTMAKVNSTSKSKTPALDFFATHLTSDEAQRHIDPVIGRSDEIERLIQILGRRVKNNPVLLGDPGVGKTAIVEGLAKRICEGDVPPALSGKKIYSLDITLLIAGTIYRGEFESRFKQVIDELRADPSIILFIDEVHTIIGAGSTSGSLDAANILKPALARGQIRCIGATTFQEYKKYIENDPALERRFQPITVREVSHDEAVAILAGIRTAYEQHHLVHISDEALESAVSLSVRYMPEKFLPDKAIDLVDEAASRLTLKSPVSPAVKRITKLETLLAQTRTAKQQAVESEDFPKALALKEQEMKLIDKIDTVRAKQTSKNYVGTLSSDDVVAVVSSITGIPEHHITASKKNKDLYSIARTVAKRVIGQGEALDHVFTTLKRARAGFSGHRRPLGSFLFLGPSGVGKTETAKVLAEHLFGSPKALVRFDMSEFSESFNISKLIGAPAGYVGYQEGGKLTERIRQRPHSLVLFDEIEKAHPDVYNTLLQILEDGHVTDASGREVNFKNTLIVMTSNVGLDRFTQAASIGFGGDTEGASSDEEVHDGVMEEVRDVFRPEFLNRIDKVIPFRTLTKRDVQRIAKLHLDDFKATLDARSIDLAWDREVLSHIAAEGFNPEEGARNVRRYIENTIETPIADMLLKGELEPKQAVRAHISKDTLAIKRTKK